MTLVIYILVRCVTDQFVRGVSRGTFATAPKGKTFFLNAAAAAAVMLLVYLVVHPGMMGLVYLMPKWLERTLDDSANRRIALPEGFLCADAVLRLCQSVTNGLHVNEKIVERTLREYLPFLATENIMMEAVKRGGDRQELHEKIRQHSMAATARMKEGEPCDLLDRLAGDPAFGMTREELDQVMEPKLYIGRCEQQVLRFLDECAPLLRDAAAEDGAIDL